MEEPLPSKKTLSPLTLIFLTIFIDMIGFGIVIPVLPVYAEGSKFNATPTQLSLLVGIFSLLQLVCAPLFGKISDRFGRKPVLTISIFGTAVGFLVTGLAGSYWMLLLGRIIDGASGGNIATGMACIADVTTKENRSKAMGLIGAAFGLGFMIGPAMGGVLGKISPALPFFVAAGMALINCALVAWRLPETLTPEVRARNKDRASLGEVFSQGRAALISMILASQFASIVGFSIMTSLFALFCEKRFGYDIAQTGWIFFYVGFLGVIMQGGVLRRLLRRPIEKQLALIGAAILAISMYFLPSTPPSLGMLLLVCTGISIGNSLVTPTMNGLASRSSDPHTQGRVLGLIASAGSMGRFIGPMIAFNLLHFDGLGQYARTSFLVSSGILILAALCIVCIKPQVEEPQPAAVPVV
ncbi:MAG TPA: MFS transporter [Chthoniobacterales bacterium]|jgi:multidrug resistance protein